MDICNFRYFVATILIIIVVMYALCHSFKAFINVVELIEIISGNAHVLYMKNVLYLFT